MYHHRDIYVAYDGTSRISYGQEIIRFTPSKIKVVYALYLSKSGDGTSPKVKVLDALPPNTKKFLLQIHHHAIPMPLVMVMSSMITSIAMLHALFILLVRCTLAKLFNLDFFPISSAHSTGIATPHHFMNLCFFSLIGFEEGTRGMGPLIYLHVFPSCSGIPIQS